MIKVYDSQADIFVKCRSIQSAKRLINRLETDDKYIGWYQPKRYKVVIGGRNNDEEYNAR